VSRDASIILPWVDGDYMFRLGWTELEQLQEACDAGPYVIFGRLSDGSWHMKDISATIRLGLVGGGMELAKALKMVRGNVEGRPPIEHVAFAQGILGAALFGAPEEGDISKKKAPRKATSE